MHGYGKAPCPWFIRVTPAKKYIQDSRNGKERVINGRVSGFTAACYQHQKGGNDMEETALVQRAYTAVMEHFVKTGRAPVGGGEEEPKMAALSP